MNTYKFILFIYFKHNGMTSTKIIIASQAHYVNQYKNLKNKVKMLWKYLL